MLRSVLLAVLNSGQNVRKHLLLRPKDCGVFEFFDAIVTSEDVKRGKPAPDGFLLAANLIGVEPQHCVGCVGGVQRNAGQGGKGRAGLCGVRRFAEQSHNCVGCVCCCGMKDQMQHCVDA